MGEVRPDPGKLDAALNAALRDHRIHPLFKEQIRSLVFDPSDAWRACCGGMCDPCVLPLARAVDQVRAQIGWEPQA